MVVLLSHLFSQESGTEIVEVEDSNWKADAAGTAGQQLSLHLLLRVVADIGIVGFPNAGEWVVQQERLVN